MKAFLAGIRGERLFAVIPLSLMGLRPAEVGGLRWDDVDFETATIAAGKNTRPLAGAGVPDVILAAWAGHADGGTLAKRVYIHPDLSHLKAATSPPDELFGRSKTWCEKL